jgi:hypothetical protein
LMREEDKPKLTATGTQGDQMTPRAGEFILNYEMTKRAFDTVKDNDKKRISDILGASTYSRIRYWIHYQHSKGLPYFAQQQTLQALSKVMTGSADRWEDFKDNSNIENDNLSPHTAYTRVAGMRRGFRPLHPIPRNEVVADDHPPLASDFEVYAVQNAQPGLAELLVHPPELSNAQDTFDLRVTLSLAEFECDLSLHEDEEEPAALPIKIGLQECVHHLEMSPFLPFRNVTGMALGSGGGRARSPSVAQRPTGDRLSGARNRTRCSAERAPARSAR